MTKSEDLRFLSEISQDVPLTYWDTSEFEMAAPGLGFLWRIRASEASGLPRNGLPKEQVLEEIDRYEGDFVIQRMLRPAVAGACYVTERTIFWEAVSGDAQSILRDGETGSRGLFVNGRLAWSDVEWATASWQQQLVSAVDRSRALAFAVVLEWIVDYASTFYWVDVRRMSPDFLLNLRMTRPLRYESMGNRWGGPVEWLASTELGLGESLLSSNVSRIEFASGSPLSHVCTRAHNLGISTVVCTD